MNIKYLFILCVSSLLLGCSSTRPQKVAHRQVDRPLIAPHGTWDVTQRGYLPILVNGSVQAQPFPLLFLAIPFPIKYSVTDRLQLGSDRSTGQFAFALVHQVANLGDTAYLSGLDFAFEGGIEGFSYSTSEGFRPWNSWGVRAKGTYWEEHWLFAEARLALHAVDFQDVVGKLGFGAQLGRELFVTLAGLSGYGTAHLGSGAVIGTSLLRQPYVGGHATVGYNFNSHFSVSVGLEGCYFLQSESMAYLPSLGLNASW